MKKFLLSIALIGGFAFAANAELAFQYDGKSLENGATLDYKGYEYTPIPMPDGSPSGYYNFKVDPEIHLVSTSDVTVTVSTTSNIQVNLCAGGDCVSGTSNTKNGVKLDANVPLNLQMDWTPALINNPSAGMMGDDVTIPAIKVTLTAKSSTETITLTVNMGGFTATLEGAGVEGIETSDNSVYISGKNLYYDVTGNSQLSVYALSGKTLINSTVSGSGLVDLGKLPKGVYVYKLSGKSQKSGKFILK